MHIEDVINMGEGERVEFKKSLADLERIGETICAMANTRGGWILIGVKDDGSVVGVRGRDITKKLADISNRFDPPVGFRIDVVNIEEKRVVAVMVPEVGIKPVAYRGRYFIRVGSTNRLMPVSQICDMYFSSTTRSWDSTESPIDENNIRRDIVNRIIEKFQERYHQNLPEEHVMRELRLIHWQSHRFTMATMALAGNKDFLSVYPQFSVVVTKISGGLEEPINEITGNIIEIIENTLSYLSQQLFSGTVRLTAKRQEVFTVPQEALREGVINAIVHRDYTISSPVKVSIAEDGISIINPGGIPVPLTAEDLNSGFVNSIPRNPVIARIMNLLGYVEKIGSGVPRIIGLYRIYETLPHWHVRSNFTVLHLPYVEHSEEMVVFYVLKEYGEMSSSEIANKIGKGRRETLYLLQKLRDRGLVLSVGRGRSTKWRLRDVY